MKPDSFKKTAKDISNLMLSEFYALTKIPHPSDTILKDVPYEKGNCWEISCYLKNRFETILGKQICQDKYGNLWFDVEANDSKLNDAPTLALQAHMDMVFAYDSTKFKTTPNPKTTKIELVEEVINGKKILHSKDFKTSIGADNGMGVAQILAILQNKNVKHGKLRIIISNEEENALQGAGLLVEETNKNILKDIKYTLNIDGEGVGEMFVASSGSVGSYYKTEYDAETPKQTSGFEIKVEGLIGGHSGMEIHLRRVNALKFMTDLINEIKTIDKNVCLSKLITPGCSVYNAIPTVCNAIIATSITQKQIENKIEILKTIYLNEPSNIEDKRGGKKYNEDEIKNKMKINVTPVDFSNSGKKVISKDKTIEVLQLQTNLPFGVEAWPSDLEMTKLEGEQTSANIGPATLDITGTKASYCCATYSRSNVDWKIDRFLADNKNAWKGSGKVYINDSKCYGWQKDSNQKLADLCVAGWKNAGLEESKIKKCRSHGAYECSWWHKAMSNSGTITDTACISYGAQLYDVHNFTERVELDSLNQCVETTLYMLSHANELK